MGSEGSNVPSPQVTGRKALPFASAAFHNGAMTASDALPTAATSHRMRADTPVVVGADGSAESERGLLFAADLSMTLGVELVVVHALGMYSRAAGWQTPVEEHEQEAESMLNTTWCAPLADIDGLRWRGQVAQGLSLIHI